MNEANQKYARQLLTCRDFSWQPGMRAVLNAPFDPTNNLKFQGIVGQDIDADLATAMGYFPDLEDPATARILMQLTLCHMPPGVAAAIALLWMRK